MEIDIQIGKEIMDGVGVSVGVTRGGREQRDESSCTLVMSGARATAMEVI